MPKGRQERKPPVPAKFKVGDRVWVRHGIRDNDHSDIPLGGWAGIISEVHKRKMYCVRWTRETLSSIHPIYEKRCAIEGKFPDEYWLGEDDLEPDPGGPLSIEQPTKISPRPLSAKDAGDRVRMVFGLTSDDFLPKVDEESLETYYDYLEGRLSLPFEARWLDAEADFFSSSPLRTVKVVALDRELGWDGEEGIICEVLTAKGEETAPLANVELRRSDPNRQLVEDYAAWFFGELSEEEVDNGDDEIESVDGKEFGEDEEAAGIEGEASLGSITLVLLELTAFAISYGAIVGSAVATMPWARWTACIGGGVWGMLVAVANTASAQEDLSPIVPRLRKPFAGILGLIVGAIQGAFFGIMAVAFLGAALGGIVGFVLKRLFQGKRWLVLRVFPSGVLFAAACGVAAQAFYLNHADAMTGLQHGSLIGLGSALLFGLVTLPLARLTVRRR